MDIHEYDRKYAAAVKGLQRYGLSERNKELILAYVDDLVLEGLSKPRQMKYIEILRTFAKRLDKDLDKAKADDLKKIVSDIQMSDYSPWTKQMYKVIIRRFYKWFLKTPGKDYPEIVSWISIRMSRSEKKLPSEGDLIVEKDVRKLLDAAKHPRDKAFVSVLWESGARIGEIGNLQIKHVVFDKYGVVLCVKGKTGSRKIRLISSTQYVATWVSAHPMGDDPNAPLWVNFGTRNHNAMMTYPSFKKVLMCLFKKTGIKKRCNPHMFRHSRATFMANHLTEFQMNQYFGWIQGSDMPATYVHMSGREVDSAILEMNGIHSEKKKEESTLKPVICPRCETINSAGSKHCNKCGGILDIKYAMELEQQVKDQAQMRDKSDRLLNVLFNDEDVQKLLMEKLRSMGSSLPL